MQIKVKPIIVLGRREGWFCHSDGSLEFVADGEALAHKVAELSKELRQKLETSGTLLEDTVVRNEDELAQLQKDALEADAVLVYLIGVMPLQSLLQWGLPILVFSGQHTPMLALYAFGVERHSQPGITIALDFPDIDEAIQLLEARKKMQKARIVLFGFLYFDEIILKFLSKYFGNPIFPLICILIISSVRFTIFLKTVSIEGVAFIS